MLALLSVREEDLRRVGCRAHVTIDSLTVTPDATLILLLEGGYLLIDWASTWMETV